MVVARKEGTPIFCAKGCGYTVEVDAEAMSTLFRGGELLCVDCAQALARKHPEAFAQRADPRVTDN